MRRMVEAFFYWAVPALLISNPESTATERRGYRLMFNRCINRSRLALLAEPELYAKDGRGVPKITAACDG
jgi:hypothetical protein